MPSRFEFSVSSMVRGYHVYQDEWEAVLGEVLSCQREPGNRHDPYAVAAVSSGRTVGHVPRKISPICSIFIRRGGLITCMVTGNRRYSADLEQGGLEIPCLYSSFRVRVSKKRKRQSFKIFGWEIFGEFIEFAKFAKIFLHQNFVRYDKLLSYCKIYSYIAIMLTTL